MKSLKVNMKKTSTVYLEPSGDDQNGSGTRTSPVASLQRAIVLSRKVAAGACRRIDAGDGIYFNTSATLESIDSGLELIARRGAKPVFYGGERVTDWRPEGGGSPFWVAEAPGAQDIRALVVNGRFAPRARFPESGSIQHASEFAVNWMSSTKGGWERKPTEEELTTLKLVPGSLPENLSERNAELTIYHSWDESLVGIKQWDRKSGIITFSTPAGHPPGAFGGWKEQAHMFTVWNVREGMTVPGQWYLDRERGLLVYWPREMEDIESIDVIAPAVTSVLRLAGAMDAPVRDINIKGLTFGMTATPMIAGGFGACKFEGAIEGDFAHGLRLEDVTVRWTGGQGIRVNRSDGVRCRNCTVHDVGAGGMHFSGAGGVVASALVHHVGLTYPSALALRVHGENWRIHHNTIHHSPYSAVNAGGRNLRIEHNRFHHVMEELVDGAAIYVFAAKSCILRGNYTHDVRDEQVHAYYLDEQSEGSLVEGNVSVGVPWPIHNHMAWNCVVRGNVCISQDDMKITFANCDNFTLTGNVFACGGELKINSSYTGVSSLRRNIFHSRCGRVSWAFHDRLPSLERNSGSVPALPRNADSIVADPGCSCEGGKVAFAEGGLAARLGLRGLDVSGAGCGRE